MWPEQICQNSNVCGSFGQDDRWTAFFQPFNDILDDEQIAVFVFCQLLFYFRHGKILTTYWPEESITGNYLSLECLLLHLSLCIGNVFYLATLHKDDVLMTIMTHWRGRLTINISCIDGFQNLSDPVPQRRSPTKPISSLLQMVKLLFSYDLFGFDDFMGK